MQKSNDTGSILLWSICISLVLVFLFASFSTKLSEKIRFEKSLVGVIQTIFQEDSLIEGTGTEEKTSLEKLIQNSFTLQQGKSTEFRYLATNQFPLSITIQKGGPLFFKFVAFSGATSLGGITASGLIDTSISFTGNLSIQYDQGILYIKNLGGYTSFYLSGGITHEQEIQEYRAVKIVGGDEKTQKIITDTQFSPGNWGEIDYTGLDMEF